MKRILLEKAWYTGHGDSMDKILVTGGSGFIGSAITRHLVEKGYEVKIFDDFSRGKTSRLIGIEKLAEVYEGDIRNLDQLKSAFRKVDSVFHLAFINGTENFYKYPHKIMDIAVKGMQNIYEISQTKELDSFFLASSSEVYQDSGIYPTPENVTLKVPDIFNPRYSYGLGKMYQEFATIHSLNNFNRRIIFRPHNIYGPDMGFNHVIPELFLKISNQGKGDLTLKGDGSQKRSFCEINDFIHAIDLLLNFETKCEIVNIGTSEEVTIHDLANMISKTLSLQVNFIGGEKPAGETSRRVPDLTKLRSLGYQPKVGLPVGLQNYFSWFSNDKTH